MTRTRYRCSHCRKRITTEFPVDNFICSKCGCTKLVRNYEEVCRCSGYHFPHRKGSLWCTYSTIELTEADWRSRYSA